jgi:DNA polymerase II large subunit
VKTEGKKLDSIDAYCVKCRCKVEVKDPKEVKMKNGRPAISGKCPKCGTKVFRIKSNTDKQPK